MNPDLLMLVTLPGMLVGICWIIFSNIRRHRIARVQAEFQTKLLEKFASCQELMAYIESEAGRRFLESATLEQLRSNPFARILSSVQAGLILSILGIALFVMPGAHAETRQPLDIFGTLSVALGLGFLLSAGASYRLSKSFGMLEGATPRSK